MRVMFLMLCLLIISCSSPKPSYTEKIIPPHCVDSDPGDDEAFVQGQATLTEDSITDSCDGNNLIEAICENDILSTKEIPCVCGCIEGACLPEEEVDFELGKRISQSAETDQDYTVTWLISPTIRGKSFPAELLSVRLWVTESLDPKEEVGIEKLYELNRTLDSFEELSLEPWEFLYSDGSGPDYPPPIVWMKVAACSLGEKSY